MCSSDLGEIITDKASLKAFNEEWRNAGHVPFKDKQRLNETFYGKLDELYDKLNLSAEEKARDKFLQKIERLSSGENAEQSLIKEADFLRKQVDEITRSIANYENNLGFFKHAKTKNQIMIDTEEKIANEKKRIDEVKKKIQLVRETIQKMKTPLNSGSNPS